jgi:hypothetical protein
MHEVTNPGTEQLAKLFYRAGESILLYKKLKPTDVPHAVGFFLGKRIPEEALPL